ncbi:hypothetical protein IT804_003503 [Salmonella enterica]|nr:hypothetical protein [Salmonella enterica]EGC5602241.1 hypothetical protein [Salmonella enterica]EGO2951965.1 hypothetical protein [Salmonella enterica]EHE5101753.1 hypothetical protein [Salmonella enterica]
MNNNADVNDTWLVGFSTEISGFEVATHMLISAASLVMAESAAVYMGRTWWPSLKREDDRYRWEFPGGVVWIISGTPGSPVIIDDYGENWLDYTR